MPTAKLEGIHYVCDGYTRTGQPRRRKPTLPELERMYSVCRDSQCESNRLRKLRGLAPVEPNFYRLALDAELAARHKARKPRRGPSLATLRKQAAELGFTLTPSEEVAHA